MILVYLFSIIVIITSSSDVTLLTSSTPTILAAPSSSRTSWQQPQLDQVSWRRASVMVCAALSGAELAVCRRCGAGRARDHFPRHPRPSDRRPISRWQMPRPTCKFGTWLHRYCSVILPIIPP